MRIEIGCIMAKRKKKSMFGKARISPWSKTDRMKFKDE